ncbi:MAG: hypothetical protein H5T98_10510 [Syntrophomonadaceae bacterium]|nr:hypothetical protein [Syntrophomonadaceae bacterium]
MGGAIYLIDDNGELVEMKEAYYDSETVLQEMLAKYPNLLAGDQMDNIRPRKWLLIEREVPVPVSDESGGQFALDHLFIDQDALPTLVEVKRSTDTRIRREVVGQMLDYAANAVVYWPIDQLRARFESRCEEEGQDQEQLLLELLGDEADVEEFWEKVKTNLRAGKIRLVFVADHIPLELLRIVEFLNSQMEPAEVYAVEIKQYVGRGLKTLVPKVYGQEQRPTTRQWDRFTFLDALRVNKGKDHEEIASKLLGWADERGLRVVWGKGNVDGSFTLHVERRGTSHSIFSVWTHGYLLVHFQLIAKQPPFEDEEKRRELQRRLTSIPGVSIPDESLNKYPSIQLSLLLNEDSFSTFVNAFDWYLEEIRGPWSPD